MAGLDSLVHEKPRTSLKLVAGIQEKNILSFLSKFSHKSGSPDDPSIAFFGFCDRRRITFFLANQFLFVEHLVTRVYVVRVEYVQVEVGIAGYTTLQDDERNRHRNSKRIHGWKILRKIKLIFVWYKYQINIYLLQCMFSSKRIPLRKFLSQQFFAPLLRDRQTKKSILDFYPLLAPTSPDANMRI